jgi:hypothetical protein
MLGFLRPYFKPYFNKLNSYGGGFDKITAGRNVAETIQLSRL